MLVPPLLFKGRTLWQTPRMLAAGTSFQTLFIHYRNAPCKLYSLVKHYYPTMYIFNKYISHPRQRPLPPGLT